MFIYDYVLDVLPRGDVIILTTLVLSIIM